MSAALEAIAGPLESLALRPGAPELPLALPRSVEQAAELLRLATADGLAVVPVGNGSKLGWCHPPERADFLLSTRRLNGVVAHEPADGTLTAQAGCTLHTLRETARGGGHFLTPDVARPAQATLGGVLGAGESGLDRLRFGPARDHVLGMTVLLGDGTTARTGGRLVKNVTGFDLHKLYCGSHGSLCLIVEATLRLFPEPEHELVISQAAASEDELERLAAAALALPARTVSLVAERENGLGAQRGAWQLTARLFGKTEAVEAERALFASAWPDAELVEDTAARAAAEQSRDRAAPSDTPLLRVTGRATKVWRTLTVVDEVFARPAVRVQPGVAILECPLPASENLSANCARLRAALGPGTGVRLLNAATTVLDAPAPGALAMMSRLQANLDPRAVFARGRLGGGL